MRQKTQVISIAITIIIVLLTSVGGLLSNAVVLPKAVKSIAWPLLVIITLALVGFTIWELRRHQEPDLSSLRQQAHYRSQLLAKVHTFWIRGVFEQSLHGAALIALGLHEQPNAVENTWHLVLQQQDQPARSLPSGIRITQVYDEVGGELLILGEPGSGKTTLLLELARNLLNRAKADNTYPMPVVFNLSSWVVKRQPLTDWLVEELDSKYHVPRKLGQSYIEADQLLLLLDGLDEVPTAYRLECIAALNAYKRTHGLVPLVVCSRSAEYLSQKPRLQLHTAVVIQPLAMWQIDEYLSRAGEQLAALRVVLSQDRDMQELSRIPLMLNLMALTYHGVSVESLTSTDSPQKLRQQIFEEYVKRMLKPRGIKIRYTSQQMIIWLAWLAQQIVQQNEFYIKQVQPHWLLGSRWYQSYNNFIEGQHAGSLLGLIVGPVIGFVVGIGFGWSQGLIIGLIISVLMELVIEWAGFRQMEPMKKLIIGLTIGQITGGILWILIGLRFAWTTGLIVGLAVTALAGLLAILFFGFQGKNLNREQLIGFVIGFIIGFVIGFVIGLAVRLLFKPYAAWAIELATGLLTALFIRLLGELLDEESGWKIGWFVIPIGIPLALALGWIVRQTAGLTFTAFCSIGFVLGLAILAASDKPFKGMYRILKAACTWLLFDDNGYVGHFVLRLFLWHAKFIPWNYSRFLDYSAERVLLRKVGSSYIFVHRLLLEYFASLDSTPIHDEAGAQKQRVLPVS